MLMRDFTVVFPVSFGTGNQNGFVEVVHVRADTDEGVRCSAGPAARKGAPGTAGWPGPGTHAAGRAAGWGAVSPEQACSLQQPHLPACGRAACHRLTKRPLQ